VTAKVLLWYDGSLGRRAPRGGGRGWTDGPHDALPAVVWRGRRATRGAGNTSRRHGVRVGLRKVRPWTARGDLGMRGGADAEAVGVQARRRAGTRRRGTARCGSNPFQPRRLRAHFSLKN
jgi:hypothetical protein